MAKIYVSPSTQVNNPYATGSNERDEMRKVRDHLVPMLQSAGHEVRTTNATNNIGIPIRDANSWGANYYLALHTNATGLANSTRRGISFHIYGTGGTSRTMANALVQYAKPLVNVPVTIATNQNLGEVRDTRMPAVLSENDFHDSVAGSNWIKSNHRTIAIYHARAMCSIAGGTTALEAYLNKTGGATPPPAVPPTENEPDPTPGNPPSIIDRVKGKLSGLYVITAMALNVRSGPGAGYRKTRKPVSRGEAFTIVETKGVWGRLKSGAGWINLNYARRIR